jgi:fatty-acyl-CoA synthase
MNRTLFSDDRLSYAHGASDVPLVGATIGDVFDRVVEHDAEREALVSCHQHLRYTYRRLQAEVNRLAHGLMALGIGKGDRIGIWSPNHAEWVVTQYAMAKIGAILVNINPAYRVHELEYALTQSECSTIIIGPPFKTTNYASLLAEVCPELTWAAPGQLHAVRLPDLRIVIAFGLQQVPGAYRWDEVLRLGETVPTRDLQQRQSEVEFDDPINIQYTSGTTGLPKGATLSHHSILNNLLFFDDYLDITADDRLCVTFPFFHTAGMVMSSLSCVVRGAAMVLPAPGFETGATLETVDRERCTALHGAPTMFIAELNHPDFNRFDLSSLRVGFMAGAPLSD